MQSANVASGGRQIVAEPDVTITSREAAALLGCSHARVLGQIEAIAAHRSNLSGGWFRRSFCRDARGGRQLVYEMTRDGFALLVIQQTGKRAADLMSAIDVVWGLVETMRGTPRVTRA